jgi:hypothetical protein
MAIFKKKTDNIASIERELAGLTERKVKIETMLAEAQTAITTAHERAPASAP